MSALFARPIRAQLRLAQLATLAAIIDVSRFQSANPNAGLGVELREDVCDAQPWSGPQLHLSMVPQAVGEVRGESLRACVARLLRVVNCEAARAHAIASGTESLRWCEGGRSDEYLQRRAVELLALFVSAQRQGCGVLWG